MASAEMAEYYSSTSPNTVTFETTTEVPSVVTTTKKHRISKIIRKIYTKFIDLGDGYGASVVGPGLRQKTLLGVFLSTIFRLVFLAVVLWNFVLLCLGKRETLTEGRVELHAMDLTDDNYYDIPLIRVHVRQQLYYYEKDAPSLQQFIVVDKLGYEKDLSTYNRSEYLPISQGTSGTIDSFINNMLYELLDDTHEINPDQIETNYIYLNYYDFGVTSDIDSGLFEALETTDNARKITAFSHDFQLHVRFHSDLPALGPCKLQIGVIHNSDFNEYFSVPHWMRSVTPPTLVVNTWNQPIPYIWDVYESIRYMQLRGSYDIVENSADFGLWYMLINYVPNFVVRYNYARCNYVRITDYFTSPEAPITSTAIIPLDKSTTRIYIFNHGLPEVTSTLIDSYILLYIQNENKCRYPEVMKVLAIEQVYVTVSASWVLVDVERTTTKKQIDSSCVDNFDQYEMLSNSSFPNRPTIAPPEWTCNLSAYSDGTKCDCECGAPDPDCDLRMPEFLQSTIPMNHDYFSANIIEEGMLCYEGKLLDASMNVATCTTHGLLAGEKRFKYIGTNQTFEDLKYDADGNYRPDWCPSKPSLFDDSNYRPSLDTKIKLDYMFYILPRRRSWSEDYNLNIEYVTPPSQPPVDDGYFILPGRGHHVVSDGPHNFTGFLPTFPCYNKITTFCPTKTLTLQHFMNINQKYYRKGEKKDGVQNTLHFQHQFVFQHSPAVEEQSAKYHSYYFAEFDGQHVLHNYAKYSRSAYMDFSGNYIPITSGPFSRSKLSFIANPPQLLSSVKIELDPEAVKDLMRRKRIFQPYLGTWGIRSNNNEENLDKFLKTVWDDCEVEFSYQTAAGLFDGVIDMKPGRHINLVAFIQPEVIYYRGVLGKEDIKKIRLNVIRTQSIITQTVDADTNKLILDYTFYFQDAARIVINTKYNIFQFATSLGGAIGLFSIGMAILDLVQKFINPPSILQQLMDEDKRVENKLKKSKFKRYLVGTPSRRRFSVKAPKVD